MTALSMLPRSAAPALALAVFLAACRTETADQRAAVQAGRPADGPARYLDTHRGTKGGRDRLLPAAFTCVASSVPSAMAPATPMVGN